MALPTLSPVVADGSALAAVVSLPRLRGALVASLLLALGTGVLATAMGCACGRAGARGGWRRVATAAAFLPVVAPPIALRLGISGGGGLAPGTGGTLAGVMSRPDPGCRVVTLLYFVGALQGRTLRSRTKRAAGGDALANDVARDDPGAAVTAAGRLAARRPRVVGTAR
ncbi:MAG: hypothetical protein IPN47_22080 [Gemmatimonadetes bacterium]|nr:hypothetical protein [Gemmatimonadota bacterium]